MEMIKTFARKLEDSLKVLPGRDAQAKMAPEHRMPHEQWDRYLANARIGGVLILFYPVNNAVHTVLIQRPDYDGVHSGQICFPGGKKETIDRDVIETALRESREEVGVDAQKITVVGQLTELYIPPSNYLITPVVAISSQRPNFMIDRSEVSEIIEPQITELLDERAIGVKQIQVRSEIAIQAPYYDIRGRIVWGATAMVISELNEIVRAARLNL